MTLRIPKIIKEHKYSNVWFPAWKRPRKNKMFSMVTVGEVGSGKSWAMLNAAELLDRATDGPTRFDISRVAFSPERFSEIVTKRWPLGTVVILDDAGLALHSRDAMNQINKILVKTFMSFRYKRLIVLLSLPVFDFLDLGVRKLMNGILEMEGIDYENEISSGKYRRLQANPFSGKIYRHTPTRTESHVSVYGVYVQEYKVPEIEFNRPSNKIVKAYEKAKKEFMDERNIEAYKKVVIAQRPKRQKRKSFNHYLKEALAVKDSLKVGGEYDITKIMMTLNTGSALASHVKRAMVGMEKPKKTASVSI